MGAMKDAIAAVAVAWVLWTTGASAEELTAARSRAIVEQQFDAFQRDDGRRRMRSRPPRSRRCSATPITSWRWFATTMPRSTGIAAPSLAPLRKTDDEASLEATLVDNDNVVWTALYSFRRAPNGDWLISGCVLAKAEGSAI